MVACAKNWEMALLKRVELLGFKSFPERTIVDFSAGISAVVGPNGCGKSNVVDAIRWVLGEQNPRALRAERMEDVIFGGTEDRGRVAVAEVTLVLDNEGQALPVPVTEVELRRRLYRSGESEYLVNRQQVRLRDIRELFLDTGIGKNAYSIMEQGKIDQILSSKPEDRRQVFEEAAGIARYQVRGVEAERKLHQARQNMGQIKTIIAEIKRSRDVLANQVERTHQFRSLQEQIFGIERDLDLIRLRELEERRATVERSLEKARANRSELRKYHSQTLQAVQESESKNRTMESEIVELRRELYGTDLKKNNNEDRITTTQERIGEIKHSVTNYQNRDRDVVKKIANLQQLQMGKRNSVQNSGSRLKELHELHLQIKSTITDIRQQIQSNEIEITQAVAAISKGDQRLEEIRARLRNITDNIVNSLDSRLQSVDYSPEIRAAAEKDISKLFERLENSLSATRDVANVHKHIAKARAQIHELKKLFASYGQFASALIDDFLSPRGIVTQKRQLDEELGIIVGYSATARARAEAKRDANDDLSNQIEQHQNRIHVLQIEQAQNQIKNDGLIADCQRIEAEIAEQQTRRNELTNDENSAAKAVATMVISLDDLESQQAALKQEEIAIETIISKTDVQLRELNETQKIYHKKAQQINEKLEQTAQTIERYQMRKTEISTEIRTTLSNFQETHAQDLSQYELDITQTESRRDLRSTLTTLREKLRSVGQVNLMAPEQFREVDERFQFFRNQLRDLEEASHDLEQVTSQIRLDSSTLFLKSFHEIRNAFQATFRRLFGGGRTELKLTEPDDPLSSGIEFYAQPPGKKLENIALLSGGERALTAVALLFSLYQVRPSPFCILDEIDAALDDENVGRLVELLNDFSTQTQFLVITHNKRTAAGAAHLFGITMEEQGVSRMVTLRLPSSEGSLERNNPKVPVIN